MGLVVEPFVHGLRKLPNPTHTAQKDAVRCPGAFGVLLLTAQEDVTSMGVDSAGVSSSEIDKGPFIH